MPRNKRESFIYSVIMCFTMVLWMSMYNVTLHMGHLSLETIREGWIGFRRRELRSVTLYHRRAAHFVK